MKSRLFTFTVEVFADTFDEALTMRNYVDSHLNAAEPFRREVWHVGSVMEPALDLAVKEEL